MIRRLLKRLDALLLWLLWDGSSVRWTAADEDQARNAWQAWREDA